VIHDLVKTPWDESEWKKKRGGRGSFLATTPPFKTIWGSLTMEGGEKWKNNQTWSSGVKALFSSQTSSSSSSASPRGHQDFLPTFLLQNSVRAKAKAREGGTRGGGEV
jgi:hypothetical protein